MRVVLAGLIFLIAIEASEQNGLTPTGFDTQVAIARPTQQAVSIAPAKRETTRVFDRKFFLLAGVATAATMLDVTTTSRCMSVMRIVRRGTHCLAPILPQRNFTGLVFQC